MISPERCFAPSAPPPPANHSTDLDGDLAVVTSYFNPCGYRLRREHYDRFAENLDRQGVPLFTVELTIRDRPAVLRQYPNVRILGSDQVLWHKERLLNLLIRSLPSRFDKVAWIDADVLLQDPDWPAQVREVLRRVPITQLFSELLLLDRLGHPFSKRQGVASAAKRGHPGFHNLGHFHPGMAWAARRELIDCHGLLDNHVLGGADSVMVCAMFGWWDHPLIRAYHPSLQQAMLRWGESFYCDVRGRVEALPIRLTHLWHGDRAERKYVERIGWLARANFDPIADLDTDFQGLWRWRRPESWIARRCEAYFKERREDG